jgi:hypothetical protein
VRPKTKSKKPRAAEPQRQRRVQRVSFQWGQTLVETIVTARGEFNFAVGTGDNILTALSIPDGDAVIEPPQQLRPLWETGLVKFPTGVAAYVSQAQLVEEMKEFIRRYCSIPEAWLELIAHYVLMAWAYDRFTAVPYLRALGEPGTGKTRLLQVVAAIAYKSIVVCGNITGPALFRTIDLIRGTMVVDEADFKDSAEWSDVVKVLNNGYTTGFPVVRCDVSDSFKQQAFHVYGPKVISTLSRFADDALESRCLTLETQEGPLAAHIPLQLPLSFEQEALTLRNKLLRWRFDNCLRIQAREEEVRCLTPRAGQIGASLCAVAGDEDSRNRLVAFLTTYSNEQRADSPKAVVVQALSQLRAVGFETATVGEVAEETNRIANGMGLEPFTAKRVGGIIRSLGFPSKRTRDGYLVRLEPERIETLRQRFNVNV